jgi:hypothetical protein
VNVKAYKRAHQDPLIDVLRNRGHERNFSYKKLYGGNSSAEQIVTFTDSDSHEQKYEDKQDTQDEAEAVEWMRNLQLTTDSLLSDVHGFEITVPDLKKHRK